MLTDWFRIINSAQRAVSAAFKWMSLISIFKSKKKTKKDKTEE